MALTSENVFLTNVVEELPKRTNYSLGDSMTFLYCEAGSMDITCNRKKITILPQHVFVVLPHTYIGESVVSYDFRFTLLRVKATLFQEIMFNNFRLEPLWWEKQKFIEESPSVHLEPYYQDLLHTYLDLMTLYLKDPRPSVYRTNIMHSAVRGIILEMFNYLDTILDTEKKNRTNVTAIDYTFRQFLTLLQQHPTEREVQWFAKQMSITPKYLSEICKQRSGKSASEWIVEVTMNDIKQRLLHTADSIKEIALQLGFPNSSFFCQYVKKHTGMTPIHLRKIRNLV